MARTRSGRRLPPYSWYQTQVRSPADAAANVPPTPRQFQLAVDYNDEAEILAYLTLAPNVRDKMAATNAMVLRDRQLPSPHVGNSNEPPVADFLHTWLWPRPRSRLFRPSPLLSSAAFRGWERVLAWFFHDHERIELLRAVLKCTLPTLLADAASRGQFHTLELLLTSPVFLQDLSSAAQHRALSKALSHAADAAMCNLLVANGAEVDGHGVTRNPLPWVRAHGSGLVFLGRELLYQTVRYKDEDAIISLLAERPVVDHTVVLEALFDRGPAALERVLTEICIDVDAPIRNGDTALLLCARPESTVFMGESHDRNLATARCLLAHGADPAVKNAAGESALSRAVKNSKEELVELVLGYMSPAAVHADVAALEAACARWNADDAATERLLVALLTHGACLAACRERLGNASGNLDGVLSTHQSCTFCGPQPSPARRSKRKRCA